MAGRDFLISFTAAALLALAPSAAAAATPPEAGDLPAYAEDMDSSLVALADGQRTLHQAGKLDGLSVSGDDVLVHISAAPARTGQALAGIGRLGGSVDVVGRGGIDARIAPSDLPALSRVPGVRYMEAIRPDEFQAIQGQGVVKSGAALAQANGDAGQGAKVAVIDGGFDHWTDAQASGDLPANLITKSFCGSFTGTQHGTGVAEIVSEMAPAAQLYLVCAGNAAELDQAEQWAVSEGIDVVNRSASNFAPAVRGDGSGGPGTEDATVEDARAHGILWVNSAGNYATIHWGGPNDAAGGANVSFAPGDQTNNINLLNGRQVCLSMKWDSWPVTSQNFDLYLMSGGTDRFGPAGKTIQNGSQPPFESACYTNITGATENLGIQIRNAGGGQIGTRIDMTVSNEGVGSIQYPVPAGSVTEPGTAPEAFSVAAVCPLTDALASYSSQGPTIDGRIKPDISGYAPVSSATYGLVTGGGCSGGFNGTSAAAPHVAGAAALFKQANPAAGPDQLQAMLEGNAVDVGPPGKDTQFGSGELLLRPAQPDLLIKGRGKAVGDGNYGKGQSARRKVKPGHSVKFAVTLQNDSFLPGSFRISGRKSVSKVKTKFLMGTRNVTNQVVKGTLAVSLAAHGSQNLTIKMSAKAAARGQRSAALLVSNAAALTLTDTVKAQAKIRR